MSRVIAIGITAATMAGLGGSASAQYRDQPTADPIYRTGQPEALTAPALQPDSAALGATAFRSNYARAGSPRVMVMWNKAFTDEVGSAYRNHLHVEDDKNVHAASDQNVARTWYGAAARQDVRQDSHETLDATDGAERVVADRPSPLDEGTNWQIESAFADELSRNGVRLVDRSMAMRTTAMDSNLSEKPNVQSVEAKAMSRDADLVVEILQASAWDSPAGVLFRISVKDVRRARSVAMFTSTGRPPSRFLPFVAGPRGYVRATPPGVSPHDIGRQLARDLMASMNDQF